MINKQQAIKVIEAIRTGRGINRDDFPIRMKGNLAIRNWNNGIFTLGIEYGYILALMEIFNINEEEIK